jgi:hypothetical protein
VLISNFLFDYFGAVSLNHYLGSTCSIPFGGTPFAPTCALTSDGLTLRRNLRREHHRGYEGHRDHEHDRKHKRDGGDSGEDSGEEGEHHKKHHKKHGDKDGEGSAEDSGESEEGNHDHPDQQDGSGSESAPEQDPVTPVAVRQLGVQDTGRGGNGGGGGGRPSTRNDDDEVEQNDDPHDDDDHEHAPSSGNDDATDFDETEDDDDEEEQNNDDDDWDSTTGAPTFSDDDEDENAALSLVPEITSYKTLCTAPNTDYGAIVTVAQVTHSCYFLARCALLSNSLVYVVCPADYQRACWGLCQLPGRHRRVPAGAAEDHRRQHCLLRRLL